MKWSETGGAAYYRVAGQEGMSALGFAVVLLLVAFIATFALKLTPIYIENFKVNESLKSLRKEESAQNLDKATITSHLLRRFMVNNVENVQKRNIKIKRANGKLNVNVAYEVRKPFLGNLDIVVSFNNSVELPAK